MSSVFNIKQPKDNKSIKWSNNLASRLRDQLDRRQAFIDSECIRLMNPLTPRLNGFLADNAPVIHTVIGSGEIRQEADYARRQYYEHKSKSRWFEVMKNRHKDSILKGAERIT